MKALDGLKVIDLSLFLPAQYCSTLLSDPGADVMMVESLLEAKLGQAERDLMESSISSSTETSLEISNKTVTNLRHHQILFLAYSVRTHVLDSAQAWIRKT